MAKIFAYRERQSRQPPISTPARFSGAVFCGEKICGLNRHPCRLRHPRNWRAPASWHLDGKGGQILHHARPSWLTGTEVQEPSRASARRRRAAASDAGGRSASITGPAMRPSAPPAMIMTAVDLVHRKGPRFSRTTPSAKKLEGNLCRCTGYQKHRSVDRGRRQGDGQLRPRVIDISAPRFRNNSCTNSSIIVRRLCGRPPNLLVKNEDAKVIAGGHTLFAGHEAANLASPPHSGSTSPISKELDGPSRLKGPFAGDWRDGKTRRLSPVRPLSAEAIPAAGRTCRA